MSKEIKDILVDEATEIAIDFEIADKGLDASTTMKIHSSRSKTEVMKINQRNLFKICVNKMTNFKKLVKAKIGDIHMTVMPEGQMWIVVGFAIRMLMGKCTIIKPENRSQRPVLHPDKPNLIMCFPGDAVHNIAEWCNQGWIGKNEWVFCIAKPEYKESIDIIKEKTNFIDCWKNAQQQQGMKFPDCDKYHLLDEQVVEDPDNNFIEGECQCGYPGRAFTVEALREVDRIYEHGMYDVGTD